MVITPTIVIIILAIAEITDSMAPPIALNMEPYERVSKLRVPNILNLSTFYYHILCDEICFEWLV
jgi:hypothetical protein